MSSLYALVSCVYEKNDCDRRCHVDTTDAFCFGSRTSRFVEYWAYALDMSLLCLCDAFCPFGLLMWKQDLIAPDLLYWSDVLAFFSLKKPLVYFDALSYWSSF